MDFNGHKYEYVIECSIINEPFVDKGRFSTRSEYVIRPTMASRLTIHLMQKFRRSLKDEGEEDLLIGKDRGGFFKCFRTILAIKRTCIPVVLLIALRHPKLWPEDWS